MAKESVIKKYRMIPMVVANYFVAAIFILGEGGN